MTDKHSSAVVVSRELLGDFQTFLEEAFDGGLEGILQEDCGNHIETVRALLAAPVEQQGEPLAWMNSATGHVTTSQVVVMDWDDEKEVVQSLYRHAQPPAKLEMAHVVRAHMDIPGCPVLTSNQCHSLAMKLNAALNQCSEAPAQCSEQLRT